MCVVGAAAAAEARLGRGGGSGGSGSAGSGGLIVGSFGTTLTSENESGGSSGQVSGDTRTPLSGRILTPNESQARSLAQDPRGPRSPSACSEATPVAGLARTMCMKLRADTRTATSSHENQQAQLSTGQRPASGSGITGSGNVPAFATSDSREGAAAEHERPLEGAPEEPPKMPTERASADDALHDSGTMIFSLHEENNFLSPKQTVWKQPILEDGGQDIDSSEENDPDDARCATWHGSPHGSDRQPRPTIAEIFGDGLPETAAEPLLRLPPTSVPQIAPEALPSEAAQQGPAAPPEASRRRLAKKNFSEPWDVPPAMLHGGGATVGAAAAAAAQAPTSPSEVVAAAAAAGGGSPANPVMSPNSVVRASSQVPGKKKERQAAVPVRTPMLWSEDELAAFLSCLGITREVCLRVRRRKLKGIVHLLEMSNSELRREFGLSTPAERLVVRQSLKRLFEADRWEHSVRGHKVGDLLSDSVLAKHIIPMEELTLLAKISQGGYGTVYRGVLQHGRRSQLVAAKEMRGERRVRLYELLKEACVMASLKHPNISAFIGVCADSNSRKQYILSELADCSLFDLIHQAFKLRWHGELNTFLVLQLALGIGAGIVYIHANHVVHADLKSSNILVDYSSSWSMCGYGGQLVPRICDFGHAAVRTFPSPHHRCGTPHWAAPEVLRGEALGPKADMFSVGVLLWEMLAQRLPHKSMSFAQVLGAVGWAGWTPDLAQLPVVPQDLRRLVKECLAFSPSTRPLAKDAVRRLRRLAKQARSKALEVLTAFFSCEPRSAFRSDAT